jgi:hypothetical protein
MPAGGGLSVQAPTISFQRTRVAPRYRVHFDILVYADRSTVLEGAPLNSAVGRALCRTPVKVYLTEASEYTLSQ